MIVADCAYSVSDAWYLALREAGLAYVVALKPHRGIDPHKSSHTAVGVDSSSNQLARLRFGVNACTFRQLMAWCKQWPDRRYDVNRTRNSGAEAVFLDYAAGHR